MIDPVAFKLGTLEIRWYGIIISIAILAGTIFSIREAEKQGIDEDFMLDLFIRVIPAAIIGARLYYVLFSWSYYKDKILMIFAFRSGGLAIHGAVIAGLLTAYYFTNKNEKSFWQLLDITAPYLVLGQAIGRWGNFINKEAHGGVVSEKFISIFPDFIEKQMFINGRYYHPTFLYESLWNILTFSFLIYIRRKSYIKRGEIFLAYVIIYSTGRFFIEGMRTDSLMLGPLRITQLLSLILILAGTFLVYKRHRK